MSEKQATLSKECEGLFGFKNFAMRTWKFFLDDEGTVLGVQPAHDYLTEVIPPEASELLKNGRPP